MSKETTVKVVTDVPAPLDFLKRIPLKKVAVATIAVAAVALAGQYVVESKLDVDVETTDTDTKA